MNEEDFEIYGYGDWKMKLYQCPYDDTCLCAMKEDCKTCTDYETSNGKREEEKIIKVI